MKPPDRQPGSDEDAFDEAVLALFEPLQWKNLDELAVSTGSDNERVAGAIARLEEAGYVWEKHPARGLLISRRSSYLLHSEVTPYLETRTFGRTIYFFRTVQSTNDSLLRGPYSESPPGSVVVAEEQSKGRGRLGREWTAPPFQALQFSIRLEPSGGGEAAALSTLCAGIAVAEAVQKETGIELLVRWPNDLVYEEQKVCGILSEYRTSVRSLVVGIGLNVNQEKKDVPDGGTSLRAIAGGGAYNRGPLLAVILNLLESWFDRLESEGFEAIRLEAERLSSLIGKRVTLNLGDRTLTEWATGIGPRGGIVLGKGSDAKEYRVGEVTRVLSWEGP